MHFSGHTSAQPAFLFLLGIFSVCIFFLCVSTSSLYAQASCSRTINPGETIQAAVNVLTPGNTLCLAAGTYDQSFTVTVSGTASNRIMVLAVGEAILTGSGGSPEIITITGDYVSVEGFTLRHEHRPRGNKFGWITIRANADHANIRNNRLVLNATDAAANDATRNLFQDRGIIISPSDGNLIENNYISGVDQGIFTDGLPGKRLTIRGNHTYQTWASGLHIGSPGGSQTQHILVENNLFEESITEDGIQFTQDFNAPNRVADVSNLGTIIRNNVFKDNNENAIDLKGAGDILIEGNVLYGTDGDNNGRYDGNDRNARGGITRGTDASSDGVIIRRNIIYDNAAGLFWKENSGTILDHWYVYNNTIVNNNHDYTGANSTFVVPATDFAGFHGITAADMSNNYVKNNIIAQHQDGEVGAFTVQANGEFDANLYWNTAAVTFRYQASGKIDFATWKQRLPPGFEIHSLVGFPQFVRVPADFRAVGDHTNLDFHLVVAANNPAIDHGSFLTRTRTAGSGTQVPVVNAGYFSDGNGTIAGDTIRIGSESVRITAINPGTNTLTIDRFLTWTADSGVSQPYTGSSPDIGAYEVGIAVDTLPTLPPSGNSPSSPTITPTPAPVIVPATIPFMGIKLGELSRSQPLTYWLDVLLQIFNP